MKLKDKCDKETLPYCNIFNQKIVLLTLHGSYSGTSLSWLCHPVKLYNKTKRKVLVTSVCNKPSLYSNIFKHRQTHDSPIVQ